MRYTLLGLLAFSLSSSAAAQTVPQPGMIAAPAPALTEPLVVNADAPNGATITGQNGTGPNSVGVAGIGLFGVTGQGVSYGGWFNGSFGIGVEARGRNAGIAGTCFGITCVGVTAEASSGTGLAGAGVVGVFGRALPRIAEFNESLAGFFVGPVRVTDVLHVEGAIDAPVITQLTAQVAALLSRIAVLEARLGVNGTAIPARIQAEDYDRGGQGVGYFDTTPGNTGGVYRTDDVDIKEVTPGDYVVGWMAAGEWLAYTVDVPQTGPYVVTANAGSALAGRTFRLQANGVDITGPVAVPQFSDWDMFGTVSLGQVTLPAGRQVLKLVVGDQDFLDLQWIEITR